uniref:hypothetical protein n=1 Tax=Parerythrobacter lutipelagi TaxID=1964208 RepID=UPI0010F67198|nr:hypothetical protein [Parerythrobacter lutipelagi]
MRNLVILGMVSLLAACSGEGAQVSEAEADASATTEVERSADGETRTTTIPTEGGTATMRSGPGAAIDLPLGFEVYPGAQVLQSTSFAQNGDKGALLTFVSDSSPEDLIAYYRKKADQAGIEIEMELTTDNSMIIGGKGAKDVIFSFSTVPGGDKGKTQGQLMIGSAP